MRASYSYNFAPIDAARAVDLWVVSEDPSGYATGDMSSTPALSVIPVTLKRAREFVRRVHRHHRATVGGLFAVGLARSGTLELVGVAIVGRPVSRHVADGWTCEVTRVATDGSANGCSMLYGAAWRAARALGYRKMVTYTLATEPGTSLRAAGFRYVGRTPGGSWSRESRPRADTHPTEPKHKWELSRGV